MKKPSKPNPAVVAGRTFKEILLHPITYAPAAAVAVANAIIPIAWWANLPLVITSIIGEVIFWKGNWTPIYEKHEAEIQGAHSKRFNEEILQSVWRNKGPVRDLVEEMVQLKQQAEAAILADNRINTKEREILDILEETLLQTAEAAQEEGTDNQLVGGSTGAWKTAVTQEMQEALATIRELVENLDSVLQPLNPTPEEKKMALQSGLAQSTQALRNRMEESRQVKRLIEEAKRPRA